MAENPKAKVESIINMFTYYREKILALRMITPFARPVREACC